MAALFLSAHPINGLPLDYELSLVFETEDPFHMPLDRLKVLIESTEPGTDMRGYRPWREHRSEPSSFCTWGVAMATRRALSAHLGA